MNEFLINWLYGMATIGFGILVLIPMVWLLIKDYFVWACVYLFFLTSILLALGATFA